MSDAALRAARHEAVTDFVHALALSQVPMVAIIARAQVPTRRVSEAESSKGVPLGVALDQFAQSHPDYSVSELGSAVFLKPMTPSACEIPLERPISLDASGPANEALYRLAKQMAPGLPVPDVPPSIMVSGHGADETAAEHQLWRKQVRVSLANLPAKKVMAALASNTPGVVWVVEDIGGDAEAAHRCVLALITHKGTLTTSYEVQ